ncbi:hypothetical protein GUY44_13680 [Pimelobacter simplex]|uniref:Uncharacterized protein n=1 Tax=Nocardioides simplex TaxID=2045 RepID=A0A0A1DKZ2_NOCSI|nr:hypothetical protein [Pimelobacter simplex]AIY17253.1 hypothetical protein KR76_11710 [Pimelobacter simplex]MCG8151537.1 hypothetical protein [Pimelobacter simplex]GEB13279.1 hypothetical protein NSI01_15940 [Pimelobacter simplex]SFM47057.1 hypothetical protein SAMN05421671_1752 [Pimelobacter simplex]
MNLATNLLAVLLLVMIVLALVIWVRRDDLSTGRDLHGERRAAHRDRTPDTRTIVARPAAARAVADAPAREVRPATPRRTAPPARAVRATSRPATK